MGGVVRKLLFLLAALAAVVAFPGRARADDIPTCAPLPAKKPVWIDFADGSVPFWQEFAKPGVVAAASNLLYPPKLRAAGATPYITENELFGASLPIPWSASNTQYRANVLLYLRTLAARGGHPYLLVSSRPYTAGEAGGSGGGGGAGFQNLPGG